MDVVWASCGLLFFFALIVFLGIRESASLALVICSIHVTTLVLILILGGLYAVFNDLGELRNNLNQPYPDVFTVRLELQPLHSSDWGIRFHLVTHPKLVGYRYTPRARA